MLRWLICLSVVLVGVVLAAVAIECRGGASRKSTLSNGGFLVSTEPRSGACGAVGGVTVTAVAWPASQVRSPPTGWMQVVAKVPRMRRLEVPYTDLNDDALKQMQSLPYLEVVDFSHTAVTDQGLCALGEQQPRLRSVSFYNTSITDDGIACLPVRNITTLELGRTDLSGLRALEGAVALEVLSLVDTAVDSGELGALVALPIRELHLDGTRVDDEAVPYLLQMPNLERVNGGSFSPEAVMTLRDQEFNVSR